MKSERIKIIALIVIVVIAAVPLSTASKNFSSKAYPDCSKWIVESERKQRDSKNVEASRYKSNGLGAWYEESVDGCYTSDAGRK